MFVSFNMSPSNKPTVAGIGTNSEKTNRISITSTVSVYGGINDLSKKVLRFLKNYKHSGSC